MSEFSDPLLKCLAVTPESDAQIEEDIRRHRMHEARVRVVDAGNCPVAGASIELRQASHAFGFGGNCFMLDEAPSPELNARYESLFERLFNLTVVPLYWSDLEPVDGQPRFAADSPPVFRRPSVERVLGWCERTGITPKAHPLVWQRFWPEWLRGDQSQVRERLVRRFAEITTRFGTRINLWDVVNEALDIAHYPDVLPDDHVVWAFEQARAQLPATACLYYNETVHSSFEDYRREYTPLYLLLQNLILRGAKLDGVGLQFHFWAAAENAAKRGARLINREHLRKCLDLYARLGRPIHISEISIPTWGDGALQAELVRQLYRLWFSHQAVTGIVWWNLSDGGAETGNENDLGIGLIGSDYQIKPAYAVLDELINHQWRTNAAWTTDREGHAGGAVFDGDYQVTARSGPESRSLRLRLTRASGPVTICLENTKQ